MGGRSDFEARLSSLTAAGGNLVANFAGLPPSPASRDYAGQVGPIRRLRGVKHLVFCGSYAGISQQRGLSPQPKKLEVGFPTRGACKPEVGRRLRRSRCTRRMKSSILHQRLSPAASRLTRRVRPTAWAITPARRMQPRGRATSPMEPVHKEDETSILHPRPSPPRRRGSLREFALPRARPPTRCAARRRSRPAFAGWQSRPGSGYARVDRPVVACTRRSFRPQDPSLSATQAAGLGWYESGLRPYGILMRF